MCAHIAAREIEIRELLARLRAGNREALGILYELFYDSLWRLSAIMTRSSDTAEEIVQEVFLSLWVRRETLDIHTDIRVYLNGAVRNLVYKRRDHQHVVTAAEIAVKHLFVDAPALGQRDQLPDAAAETDEFYVAYRRVLATLTERDSTALRLRWEEGMTLEQIAEVLGLSVVGARGVILRAQQKVQDALKAYRS